MNTTNLTRAILAGLATAILFYLAIMLAVTSAKAEDQDSRWVTRNIRQQYRHCDEWGQCYYRWRYREVRVPIRYYRDASPRYDYDREDRHSRHCRDIRRAVGDQHLTVDGAKKAANDAWAGTIRFHMGERFMDLANARNVVYTCSRSSIKEAGTSVTTLGQALMRCELEAQPCSAMKEEGGDR